MINDSVNLDINNEDIDKLIQSHSEPLSNVHLIKRQEMNKIQN